MGLDPDPRRMPTRSIHSVYAFNKAIVDATRDLVCAYKPNGAFYEAFGIRGVTGFVVDRKVHSKGLAQERSLSETQSVAMCLAPVLHTPTQCSDAVGFDAVTVNGYLGRDSVEPFFKPTMAKAYFVLCRTSNPDAGEFQDIQDKDGVPLYQRVAQAVAGWSADDNLGLVVGATYPEELKAVRDICPQMPILIPGVGSQAGDLRQAMLNGTDARGRRAIISASRSIIYASSGPDFAEAARREASTLRDRINDILETEGLGWS